MKKQCLLQSSAATLPEPMPCASEADFVTALGAWLIC